MSISAKQLKKNLGRWHQAAKAAMAAAIKDCPTCSVAQAITCTDCEERYKAALEREKREK